MATDPNSYLTAAIIIGVFSLVALFGGIAIPLIEKGKLNDQITSDQMLVRENSLAWGTVPGSRNISYIKTFTLFSLNASADQVLQGTLDATPAVTATYNYEYQYTNLLYAPAVNGSVRFYNSYNHTYMGADENDLKSTYINTINVGAFRGVTQQADMSQAQVFIQNLYKIYTSFQEDIITLIISDYVYEFYIKNQTLTNNTIFMFRNTVTPALSDQLWSDPDYGWSTASTLLPWVTISLGYYPQNYNYNPATAPQYSLLKNHFNLTDAQMMALIGGQPAQSSLLYVLILSVQNALTAEKGCSNTYGCNATELFAQQFFTANITKRPVLSGIEPKDSVADMNQTYPTAPEIAAVNPQNIYFEPSLSTALFGFNSTTNLPLPGQQTLFGLQNVEFILQNQGNPTNVATYLSLDNAQQAQVLIDYVNYIISDFAYQGKNNLETLKYTADMAVNNMNNLPSDMANLMSVNLTALGTYNIMKQQNKTCADLLQDINANSTIITSVCGNPYFTLDSPEGQAPWVAAFYAGDGSNIYNIIETETGIDDSDMQTLMQTTSQLGGNIQTIVNAIATSLNCGQGPCASSFISNLQWATSGFTRGLPSQYFDETYESLVDIYPDHFGTFIPEFPVFANRTFGINLSLTLDRAETLFSYDVGSINNNYEVLQLLIMNQAGNSTGIKDRFNFTVTEINALLSYFDSAFIDYYMGGLIQTVSAYDLLWGYTDSFLTNLNNDNFFNNIQIFNPDVSLLGSKDSSDDSSDVDYNTINSGADNSQNVRQMTTYNGNSTLSLNQTSFDGNVYYSAFVPAWGGDLQVVGGTDGSGFAPLLKEDTPISIFEGPFLRNLNYNYQTTFSKEYDSNYDFNQYQFDTSQLAASSIYKNNIDGYVNLTGFDYTPLLISLPYYKTCEPSSYSSITFGGKSASDLQGDVDQGTFVLEALTGITANFTKNYQYNIFNLMPFFLTKTNNLAAIPLFQVTETYTTPSSNYINDLQAYYSKSHSITAAMIVVLVIAFLLMVTSIILVRAYRINSKKLSASRLNANAGDFASLGVDSDGARSSLHPLTQS